MANSYGDGWWEAETTAGIARSAEVAAAPKCRVCAKPMVCGQNRSNGGAHFTCSPTATSS